MKKIVLSIACLAPLVLVAQSDSVLSRVYDWKQPVKTVQKNIETAVLFEGSTYDMEWLQMNSATLSFSKTAQEMIVPLTEEHLYIVKEGSLTVGINDSVKILVPGSIVLLMPGQKFSIKNNKKISCDYYVMKYRSRHSVNLERGNSSGGSIVKDWTTIPFKPHDKGGIRNFFQRPTAMTTRMDIHVSTLNPGLKSNEPHTHRAAEIIVVLDGETEMQVAQNIYKGKKGSVYFLDSYVLHGIRNISSKPTTYFAIQLE